MTTNTTVNQQQQYTKPSQLGMRGQLVWEAKLGNNRIIVLKYMTSNGSNGTFIAEILKDENTQLLVLPGSVSILKSQQGALALDHYGLKEAGVSGFIKSQVTGESFVMTEVVGAGTLRLTPHADCPGIKQFQNTRLYMPNTNTMYIQALIGDFQISTVQQNKSSAAIPIEFSEVFLNNALALFETDNFYEVQVQEGQEIFIEANEIVFWTGDLMYDYARESSNGEGNLVRFAGNGHVYLSLSV